MTKIYSGIFLSEGTSDHPLAELVELLFLDRDVSVSLSTPDFSALPERKKDVRSRITDGLKLARHDVDLIVVHRDADNAGFEAREYEIKSAGRNVATSARLIPVIPVRMTEAWLLLDEAAIRHVAGNPRGRTPLQLPKTHQVERLPDPKASLAECILRAANVTGRQRDRLRVRFNQNRRQLLQRLDRGGPLAQLPSWQRLERCIDEVAAQLTSPQLP